MNHDLITPLVEAATTIVAATRKAAEDAGQPISDLRIPIVVGKSDLRIVIESGPKIAATNAVAMAQIGSGSTPGMSRDDAIQAASDIISVIATELRQAHSRYGEWPNGESEAKQSHDEMLAVVAALKGGAA